MRMRKVKTPGDRLRRFFAMGDAVSVAVEVVDGNLKTIVLTASTVFGEVPDERVTDLLVIKMPNSYSDTLEVLEREPPEQVEKWLLRGTFFGAPFSRMFDQKDEAKTLLGKMRGACKGLADAPDEDDINLEVVPIMVDVEKPE